jgi:hypothetical protein
MANDVPFSKEDSEMYQAGMERLANLIEELKKIESKGFDDGSRNSLRSLKGRSGTTNVMKLDYRALQKRLNSIIDFDVTKYDFVPVSKIDPPSMSVMSQVIDGLSEQEMNSSIGFMVDLGEGLFTRGYEGHMYSERALASDSRTYSVSAYYGGKKRAIFTSKIEVGVMPRTQGSRWETAMRISIDNAQVGDAVYALEKFWDFSQANCRLLYKRDSALGV